MSGIDLEKEGFWRLILAEHSASGLNIRDFCRQEDVPEASFYSWRRRISQRDQLAAETGLPASASASRAAPHSGSGLLRVKVIGAAESIGQSVGSSQSRPPNLGVSEPIEILTPNGFTIRVCQNHSQQAIVEVLQATTELMEGSC